MEFIIAIAALCSVPIPNRLSEEDVLKCQKYYVKCMKDDFRNKTLIKCILQKKKLGGDE